jgi:poly-gamma-glutamate capsule biosynthesis protein CapA/YwtB (metallophosphatase superfamily)
VKKFVFAGFIFLAAVSQAYGQEQNSFVISAVGDIMMGTDHPTDRLPPNDGRQLFRYTKNYIQSADIRFGNFEDTFYDGEKSDSGKAEGENRFIFRTPTRFGGVLADAGFNVVSLANNHALDFGSEGILSTKTTLQQNGIQYSSKSSGEVAEFIANGVRVALIACDFYRGNRSVTTPERTYREIQRLKTKHDVVIVSAHVGGEGSGAEHVSDTEEVFLGENRGNSVSFAHGAIDAGAGLILMHGPHIPRAMEVYNGHLIVYSLGNFLTERGISVDGIAGYAPLLRAQIGRDGKFIQGFVNSFKQDRRFGLVYDGANSAKNLIERLSNEDFPESAPFFKPNGLFYPKN